MQAEKSESEDSYLASVSDMMVGLLFIFIIFLMVFALNFKAEEERNKLAQEQKVREVDELRQFSRQLTNADEIRRRLLEDIKRALEKEGVHVFVDWDQGVVRLPESLLFPSGSATFRASGKQAIERLADTLIRILPCYSAAMETSAIGHCPPEHQGRLGAVFIEGHTDNVPIGKAQFRNNWELSVARAMTTYEALIRQQPQLDELKNREGQPLLSVSAYESRRPVASNETAVGRQKNRRIDLRFLMAPPTQSEIQQRIRKAVTDDIN